MKYMRFFLFTVLVLWVNSLSAQNKYLEPSSDGRYLQWNNGTPFFVMACTAWILPTSYEKEEVTAYLDYRVKAGYTTIQMSAVFSEIKKELFQTAFYNSDIMQPVYSYWEQVDWVVKQATDRGLVVMINPIWKRSTNDFIKAQGVEKCHAYGVWFANRYKNNPNVMYFVGGDEIPEPVRAEMDAMGRGIQKVYNGKAILAYHSEGDQSSKEAFGNAEWLTLNWTYAYSPAYFKKYPYSINHDNYQKYPHIPMQFGEGYYDFGKVKRYEKGGVSGRWGNQYILRRQAWWNVTSGATGLAYGAEGIWHKNRENELWHECIRYESSKDMTRLKKIIDAVEWWKLIPDIKHHVLTDGYGTYMTDNYATAAVADDYSFALIYTPVQHNLILKVPDGKWEAWQTMTWYNPSSGLFVPVEDRVMMNKEHVMKIKSPEQNGCESKDWVLIIGKMKQ